MGLNNGGAFGGTIVAEVDLGEIDITSQIPGTGATNLGKAEDAVHASGDTGIQTLTVRKDTAAALTDADGDYAPLETDAAGRLHVIEPSQAAIQTSVGQLDSLARAEDAQHTSGEKGIMGLMVRTDSRTTLADTDGDYAPAQATANGDMRIRDDDANTLLGTIDTGTSKIPALGTAAMPASSPVTIATDDTMMTALDTAVDGLETTLTNIEKCLMGFAAPNVDSPGMQSAPIILSASTANQVLVASAPNKQIWVYGLFMMANTSNGTVALQDELDTAITGVMAVSDEGGWVLPMSNNFAMPYYKLATDKDLEADTGACTIGGSIHYAIISV